MSEHYKVFRALSDAVAIKIVELLISKPMQIGELEKQLDMPKSSVRKKLLLLKDAELICVEIEGRTYKNVINIQPIIDLVPWIDNMELSHIWAKKGL